METYQALVETVQDSQAAERDDAFGQLIQQFKGRAYQWAFDMLQDSHLAEDAVQETFITAYQHIDQIKDSSAFPGWFKRIVVSQCARLMRRKDFADFAANVLDDTAPAAEPDPSEEVEERESEERLKQALYRLPEHERTVTELFYLSEYSQHEIAERLALPVTTVKKRLQYARKHLKVEYLKGEPIQSLLMNDPLVTWLIVPDDNGDEYVVEGGKVVPLVVRSIVLDPVFAGQEYIDDSIPPFGRIAWRTPR
jgi:RNA polymerase sigma factor (sigma-70 family)